MADAEATGPDLVMEYKRFLHETLIGTDEIPPDAPPPADFAAEVEQASRTARLTNMSIDDSFRRRFDRAGSDEFRGGFSAHVPFISSRPNETATAVFANPNVQLYDGIVASVSDLGAGLVLTPESLLCDEDRFRLTYFDDRTFFDGAALCNHTSAVSRLLPTGMAIWFELDAESTVITTRHRRVRAIHTRRSGDSATSTSAQQPSSAKLVERECAVLGLWRDPRSQQVPIAVGVTEKDEIVLLPSLCLDHTDVLVALCTQNELRHHSGGGTDWTSFDQAESDALFRMPRVDASSTLARPGITVSVTCMPSPSWLHAEHRCLPQHRYIAIAAAPYDRLVTGTCVVQPADATGQRYAVDISQTSRTPIIESYEKLLIPNSVYDEFVLSNRAQLSESTGRVRVQFEACRELPYRRASWRALRAAGERDVNAFNVDPPPFYLIPQQSSTVGSVSQSLSNSANRCLPPPKVRSFVTPYADPTMSSHYGLRSMGGCSTWQQTLETLGLRNDKSREEEPARSAEPEAQPPAPLSYAAEQLVDSDDDGCVEEETDADIDVTQSELDDPLDELDVDDSCERTERERLRSDHNETPIILPRHLAPAASASSERSQYDLLSILDARSSSQRRTSKPPAAAAVPTVDKQMMASTSEDGPVEPGHIKFERQLPRGPGRIDAAMLRTTNQQPGPAGKAAAGGGSKRAPLNMAQLTQQAAAMSKHQGTDRIPANMLPHVKVLADDSELDNMFTSPTNQLPADDSSSDDDDDDDLRTSTAPVVNAAPMQRPAMSNMLAMLRSAQNGSDNSTAAVKADKPAAAVVEPTAADRPIQLPTDPVKPTTSSSTVLPSNGPVLLASSAKCKTYNQQPDSVNKPTTSITRPTTDAAAASAMSTTSNQMEPANIRPTSSTAQSTTTQNKRDSVIPTSSNGLPSNGPSFVSSSAQAIASNQPESVTKPATFNGLPSKGPSPVPLLPTPSPSPTDEVPTSSQCNSAARSTVIQESLSRQSSVWPTPSPSPTTTDSDQLRAASSGQAKPRAKCARKRLPLPVYRTTTATADARRPVSAATQHVRPVTPHQFMNGDPQNYSCLSESNATYCVSASAAAAAIASRMDASMDVDASASHPAAAHPFCATGIGSSPLRPQPINAPKLSLDAAIRRQFDEISSERRTTTTTESHHHQPSCSKTTDDPALLQDPFDMQCLLRQHTNSHRVRPQRDSSSGNEHSLSIDGLSIIDQSTPKHWSDVSGECLPHPAGSSADHHRVHLDQADWQQLLTITKQPDASNPV